MHTDSGSNHTVENEEDCTHDTQLPPILWCIIICGSIICKRHVRTMIVKNGLYLQLTDGVVMLVIQVCLLVEGLPLERRGKHCVDSWVIRRRRVGSLVLQMAASWETTNV